jgi:putative NADH-flavin reductase
VRVLLFGVTGFTGGNLARELIGRGHEVLGVARSITDAQIPDGVIAVAANLFDEDAVAALAEDVQVIAVAIAPLTDDGPLSDAVPGLLAVAEQHGARLGMVGGASSLLRTPDGPRIFDDGFPEEWKPGAQVMIDTLEALRASGTTASEQPVDWFVLSPAENYGSYIPGERTDTYRTGTEVVVADEDGRSFIGGEDYAMAFVDELETPTHHRMRFTVAY